MEKEERLPLGRIALAKVLGTDWLFEHRRTIVACFFTLIVLSFCLFQLSGKLSSKSDYLHVQKAFHTWISEQSQDPKLFTNLEKPLKGRPELETKFGTVIAQRLLSLGDVNKADRYATKALKRSQEFTSGYYSRFSKNTLLISQGKYAEALEEAKRLKAELEKDDAFWEGRDKFIKSGPILYAYNLVRIASLERELGSKEGELHAWEELVRNAGWEGAPANAKIYDPEAYALLARNFSQGDISLLDFIKERKRELTSP